MAKKPSGFHTPFAELSKKLKPSPASERPAAPAPKPTKPRTATADAEARAFLEAMDGVQPLTDRPPPPEFKRVQAAVADDDAEALAQLADLVSTRGTFELSMAQTRLEGLAPGVDRRLLRALARGDHRVEAKLDLHGLTRTEAKGAVERFLASSRRAAQRCVLIVHGKGLGSLDGLGVLKEQLPGWLEGRMGRDVLAFCSARPEEGGTGALYVLLRK